MPNLLPFAFAVDLADDLVVLDVRSDSYALVAEAIAESGGQTLWPLGTCVTEGCATALIEAGLAEDGPGLRVALLQPPERQWMSPDGEHHAGIRDLWDLIWASFAARRRLQGGLPCRTYRRSRRQNPVSPTKLERALAGLQAARLLIPTPARCLPASLIVTLFLRRRGIQSDLVFGVRTHPFAAHCWVEVGGHLLDDELDRVRAYRPICVGDA